MNNSWQKFECSKFVPHLFIDPGCKKYGCGANALALITGINPLTIKNPNKAKKEHWSDHFVVNFLKNRGFQVRQITDKNTIKEVASVINWVHENHVILYSQRLSKKEASWLVMSNGYSYHNFDIFRPEYLDFINRPIVTMYAVCCDLWKNNLLENSKKNVKNQKR